MRSRTANGESNAVLPWHVIRQDTGGGRYRVGSYTTRSEAERVARRLGRGNDDTFGAYLVERMGRGSGRSG